MKYSKAKIGSKVFVCPAQFYKNSREKLPVANNGIGIITALATEFCPYYQVDFNNGTRLNFTIDELYPID